MYFHSTWSYLMKKILLLLICIVSHVSVVKALDKSFESRENYFSGRLEVGALYINSNSQLIALDVNGIDKKIDTQGKSKSNLSLAAPFLLFELNYELSDDLLIYSGTPFLDDKREGLSIGIEKLFSNESVLDIAFFADTTSVWEDPYISGIDRKSTDNHSAGLNINLMDIIASNFSFNFLLSTSRVDKDVSGKNDPRLRRSGYSQLFKPGYSFIPDKININMALTTSLIYQKNNSDDDDDSYDLLGYKRGSAYSYDKFGIELRFDLESEKNGISIILEADRVNNNRENPIFKKKLHEKIYLAKFFYTRKNLWRSNWYMRIGCGIQVSDSNTDFFDNYIHIEGLTMGYFFE
jgi:hypothetical protein